MKWKLNHVAVLLAASMLALAGLVFFQYKWIAHSKKLSDELFHQQVSMAVCSTIEQCGAQLACAPSQCTLVPGTNSSVTGSMTPAELAQDDVFHSELRRSLDFYNIDLPFQITQSAAKPLTTDRGSTPTCTVNIPPVENRAESFISLVFPSRETYMVDKLKYMIGASLFILGFTAIVLLLANWWLLKQRQLLRRNTDMYNTMAHEFRTPLTNINLAVQLLGKNIQQPDERKFLDIISRENLRLIGQVEGVLYKAQLENGTTPLHSETILLAELLHSVYAEMEIQIEAKKAKVDFTAIPGEMKIYGDRHHLVNVFRNLIDNALKYSPGRPEITITAREEKEGTLITIQDNGIGIPVSMSSMIFEKFQRIPQDSQTDPKGFGLGLAYVKRVVEMHKGFVQLDCALRNGSRFNVFLPHYS